MADTLHQVRESLNEAIKRETRLRRKERKLREIINKSDVSESNLGTTTPQALNTNFFHDRPYNTKKYLPSDRQNEKLFLRKARTMLLSNPQKSSTTGFDRKFGLKMGAQPMRTSNIKNIQPSQDRVNAFGESGYRSKIKTHVNFSRKDGVRSMAQTLAGFESKGNLNSKIGYEMISSGVLKNFSSKISNEMSNPKNYYLVSNLQTTRAAKEKGTLIKSKSLDVAKKNKKFILPQSHRESRIFLLY